MAANGEGATLPASLNVAEDLGLITKLTTDRDPEWQLADCVANLKDAVAAVETAASFRPLVARMLNERALESAKKQEDPSDVSKGLVWLLGRDPLASIAWDGAEDELRVSGLNKAKVIDNTTQWHAFWRWCIALGYGHQLSLGGRRVLSVSSVVPIVEFAAGRKGPTPARQFINDLLNDSPVLGHPSLIETLPESGRPRWQGSASRVIAEGLLQLEAQKVLELQPGDDSENVVQLATGDKDVRAIRSVEWIGRSA